MKFNTSNAQTQRTTNLAGGEAFIESPKLALVSLLLTSFVKDQYYRKAEQSLDEVRLYIDKIPDKKFVAKAAIYARTKFNMRSISHVVAGELIKRVSGEKWMKNFLNKVVVRPDDITEITAYYFATSNPPYKETNSMRKGFALALSRFDEYQIAKYRKDGAEVSLLDTVNIFHPKGTSALGKLMKNQLKAPDTWEVKLTQAGQKAETEEQKEELKKEAWTDLLQEGKIGYFALLRNLRNIIEQVPDQVEKAASLLTNQRMIKESRVLPFRYLTAIDEIGKLSGRGARDIIVALNEAIDIAVQHAPKFEGDTLVAFDESGSMKGQPQHIGALFAAILMKSNNADLVMFASDARYVSLNPIDSTLTLAQSIKNHVRDGGTNFPSIFHELNRKYDRIIILSDMQGWMDGGQPSLAFSEYKKRFGADPRVYSFDLQGYGTLQFPERNVYCLTGFSDKVFDLMKLLEQDRNAMIDEIEKIEL